MARVVVLGGAGGIGRVAARALGQTGDATEILLADIDVDAARRVAAELGDERFSAVTLDLDDDTALRDLAGSADVVLNCVGPFYRYGPPTLAATIETGTTYVDVCDDLDATREMLGLDRMARNRGVTALIGMGNSPGLANVFARMCAEQFLDEVHTVEISHIHGGEADEGPAVLKHRIHAMTSDVPLFVDGRHIEVRMLEPSGERFIREEDFAGVGTYPTFPYPHPETLTLPATFPTLRLVTNRGVVFPLAYFEMTQELVRDAVPVDEIVARLRAERPRLLAEAGVGSAAGCLRVEVGGTVGGAPHTYVCSLSSTSEGAGEGTGIPAALGVVLGLRGELQGGPGVHPPEVSVPVEAMLTLAGEVVGGMGLAGGGVPLLIEHVGPDGATESIPFTLG